MKLEVAFRFHPGESVPVGVLSAVGRDTAFEYAASFLSSGLHPAPFRLPVKPGVRVYDRSGGMDTFGLFDDSLPDGWGRRIIDVHYRRTFGRLPTVLERLSCVGDTGMGALTYRPVCETGGIADDFDLARLADAARDFDSGDAEDVLPEIRRAGGSSGGARPKLCIGFCPRTGEVCPERETLPPGFEHWIVKFGTRAEGPSAGELEYRYSQLAVAAGVPMMPCRLLETSAGAFFATKRFDRTEGGGRLHMASAAGLVHADFRQPGEEYELLFRVTDALTREYSAKLDLFRRVSLNVFAHNRDDHLRNFAFLMDARGTWSLSPLYDFTRSDGPNGWQTLSVAGEGADPGRKDLLRLAEAVGVDGKDAVQIVDDVADAVCAELEKEKQTR